VRVVRSRGGDVNNDTTVLGEFTIQFGQYYGKTFKWIFENDIAYAFYVVATYQNEEEQGRTKNEPLERKKNKMALTKYALSFPAVADGVKTKLKEIKGQITKKRLEREERQQEKHTLVKPSTTPAFKAALIAAGRMSPQQNASKFKQGKL